MPTLNQMLSSPLICAPAGPWSSAIRVAPGASYVFTAGLVGVKADGTFDADISGQTVQAFRNLLAILGAAGMSMDHVVKLNTYLVDIDDQPRYAEARKPFLGDAHPAMTLLEVKRLARPGLRLEVEAIAAKHD